MTSPAPLPADLVLEGGGIKGIALTGAAIELLGRYRFERVAGSSAGAVLAAFLAAGPCTGRDRTYLAAPCVRRRAFSIGTLGTGLTEFDVDAAERARLIAAGGRSRAATHRSP